jgi:DNA-binding NtrC family response regulator
MTQGAELLIADSVDRDREGLRRMFDGEGYVCTAVKSNEEAHGLIQRKFFPVAVIDLDFEKLNGGLDLARFIAEKSSPTRIILLTSRRTFEAALGAMRLGLLDIVSKHPDQIAYLSGAVRKAVERYLAGDKDSTLLTEVRSVMEEAIKIMMGMYKKIYGDESSASIAGPMMKPMILIIDEDQQFLKEVAQQIVETDWEVSVELSGGAGLDKASTFAFQIVAVCDELTDLPGQILIKSVQAQQKKTLGLLYSRSGGRIDRYEEGKITGSDRPFSGARQLVSKLGQLVDELDTMRRERRYLQAFRSEHSGFLKRYAELKMRIDSLSK